jgi:hypothetical protein
MIVDKPSEAPSVHSISKVELDLEASISAKDTGASGFVIIMAPVPVSEIREVPLMFVAVIATKTLSPKTRE